MTALGDTMRIRTAAATAALLTATLTSCSGGDDTSAAPKSEPTATTSEAEPTPEPSTPNGALTLGQAWKWDDPTNGLAGSTTAIAYTQPVNGLEKPSFYGHKSTDVWGQVEAKLCIDKGEGVSASQFPWSLALPDGGRIEVSGMHLDPPTGTRYPMDAPVKAGDCIRGMILFPVPKDQRPERVIYAPEASTDSTEWTIPKS